MENQYTKENFMHFKHVVFCANEEEWKQMNQIVGFNVTEGYAGPFCYSPFHQTYSSNSSIADLGSYKDKCHTIIRFPAKDELVRTISAADAKRIIDIACVGWKDRLAKMWGENITLGYKVEIKEDFYKQMRDACTSAQHKLFDEIFKDDFKPDDWVVTTKEELGVYKPEVGEVFQIDAIETDYVRFDGYKFVSKSRIRKATKEEIRIAQIPKDGEPCWVRNYDGTEWLLRYANGKGQFYQSQKKEGHQVISWKYWMKFDPNNLPVCKEE